MCAVTWDGESGVKVPLESGIPPISKPGIKGMADDASVLTIRQILE